MINRYAFTSGVGLPEGPTWAWDASEWHVHMHAPMHTAGPVDSRKLAAGRLDWTPTGGKVRWTSENELSEYRVGEGKVTNNLGCFGHTCTSRYHGQVCMGSSFVSRSRIYQSESDVGFVTQYLYGGIGILSDDVSDGPVTSDVKVVIH